MVLTQNKKCQAYESFNKETNQCDKVCNEKEFYSEKYSSCIACDEGEVFNSQSDQCIKNDKCPPDTIPRGNICVKKTISKSCLPGYIQSQNGKRCVKISKSCPPGTIQKGNECVKIPKPKSKSFSLGTIQSGNPNIKNEWHCPALQAQYQMDIHVDQL